MTRLVLAAIILCSCLLTSHRALLVPMLQAPDEISHIDYAFSIYSAGRLLNVRESPSNWNVTPRTYGNDWEKITHVWTQYLCEATGYKEVMIREDVKVSPAYGSSQYFTQLDRNAPHASAQNASPENNPWLISGYPFGYYAMLAGWLKLVSLFTGSLVTLFFAARLFSVLLLACSLLLTYAICRRLKLSELHSLALTAVIGFFPLTTYVASAVQPDNLSLTLVLLSFYLTLREKHLLVGITLGALLVTKYHFYLCTALPIFAHYAARKRWRALLASMLPSGLFVVQFWVTSGARVAGWNLTYSFHVWSGVKNALTNYYFGNAFRTYWDTPHGWKSWPQWIKSTLWVSTIGVLALTLYRLTSAWWVLIKRRSVRMALSNPILNAHIFFLIFMVGLYAITSNSFYAQGRHFYPFLVSGLLIATECAPHAVRNRKARLILSRVVLAGLLLYSLLGGYHEDRATRLRYYPGLFILVRFNPLG